MYSRPKPDNPYAAQSGVNEIQSPQMTFQRDTLFVSGTKNAPESEWIVSYNSATGAEARVTSTQPICSQATIKSEPNAFFGSEQNQIIDMRKESCNFDSFKLAQVIISRLLSQGEVSVRIVAKTDRNITDAVLGILIASNVVKMSIALTKAEDTGDIVFIIPTKVVQQGGGGTSQTIMLPITPSEVTDHRAYQVTLIKDVFEKLYGRSIHQCEKSVGIILNEDRLLIPTIRALGVLGSELEKHARDSAENGIVLDIQPMAREDGCGIRIVVSKNAIALSKCQISHPPILSTCITLQLDPKRLTLIDLTNSILRIFIAGYVEVAIQSANVESFFYENHFSEMVLIVSKYFSVSLSHSDIVPVSLMLTRKSNSIDPLLPTPASGQSEILVIKQMDTTTTILNSIANRYTLSGTCKIELQRNALTGSRLMDIFRALIRVAGIEFHLSCIGNACIVEIRINTSETSAATAIEKAVSHFIDDTAGDFPPIMSGGDVSPNNYKPVDYQIRVGSEKEIESFKKGLDEVGDENRLSVLLVGPANIGLGIRLVAEYGPQFEFISERAVRDADGGKLKCAVRLFVARNNLILGALSNTKMKRQMMTTISGCPCMTIAESNSRITVANELFSNLNSATKSRYVFVEAKGDHCAFIGAMSVVVANGWSRSIHQRVETRVALLDDENDDDREDQKTVVFITRLVPGGL